MSNEKQDIEFIDGLIVKEPRDGAPDFIKASISMRREALIAWLQSRDGDWINADVKVAKSGKWYCAVDSWKPAQKRDNNEQAPMRQERQPVHADSSFADDEIPF